jgi:photosystem II stability/assembly factor-like uncharacterized protein
MKNIFLIFFFVINLHCYAQEGWFWQNPKPQGNSLLDIHVFDPENAIAVGQTGIVIKTTNSGKNWTVQNLMQGYASFESVHFSDEYNGWIVGYGNTYNPLIFRTFDGGITWNPVSSITSTRLHDVFFMDVNTGWILGHNGVIIKTTDGGNNWFSLNSSTGSTLYSIYFVNNNVGWAVGGDGIIINTTDGGNNWTIQTSGTDRVLRSVFFLDENYGWTVGDGGALLKTTDGGILWQNNPIGSNWINSVSFVNQNLGWIVTWEIYVGGLIYKTTDAGNNWMLDTLDTSWRLNSIMFSDSQNGYVVGNYGYIYKTINSGSEWHQTSSGNRKYGSSISFVNENTGWVAFGDNSSQYDHELLKTTNGGENWTRLPTNWIINSLFFNSENIGWSGSNEKIYKTYDGGLTWEIQYSEEPNLITSLYFLNENTGWAVGYWGTILKTTDGGSEWLLQNSSADETLQSVYFVNNSVGWTVGYRDYFVSVLKKTNDGGNSWVSQDSTLGQIYSIYAINENVAWIAGRRIAKTTDGGNFWIQQYSGASYYFEILFVDEYNGWAFGQSGSILKTTNGGEEWISQFTGCHAQLRSACLISETVGWATGDFGTILKTTNGGVITEVEVKAIKQESPSRLMLSQNYPNPFNPRTSLQFAIGSRQFVQLKVYDVLGNEIATLVNEEKSAGNYELEFDGTTLPSGIYFYQLKAGSYIATKKMVIMK